MKKNILLIVISIITLNAFAGGGWTQPKGKGFYQLGQWWIISDQHFTSERKIDPNLTIGLFNTSLYAEHGVTDRITGVLYLPFFSRNYHNNEVSSITGNLLRAGEAINTIGDPTIGLKYAIIKNKPVVLSSRVDLGIPIGSSSGEGELGILQTGDGEFNQIIRTDVSTSAKFSEKVSSYYSTYIGINNREKTFSDEFWYGGEVGFIFDKKLILTTKLTGVKSFENSSSTSITSGSIFASNAEYLNISPGISYLFTEQVGISGELGIPITGKIVFSDPSYAISLFLKI